MQDHALDAFRRLLREGAVGGQAKVDALLALAQRTVLVASWAPDGDEHRTLVNGNGQSALPVFTSRDELHRAASHFGWNEGEAEPPVRELGARQVLRYVVQHSLDYLVVDIAAPWRLEAGATEIEPLLESQSEPAGPFGGVGRLSSSVMRAVRPTPPPGALDEHTTRPSSHPPHAHEGPDTLPDHEPFGARAAASSAPPPTGRVSTPAGSRPGDGRPSGVSQPPTASLLPDGRVLEAASSAPDDGLVDVCFEVLKDYPEVEWASWCATRHAGRGAPTPAVALRVDSGFRKRVPEIVAALESAAATMNVSPLDVLLLDEPELLRTAKAEGLVFYPWRPR